MSKIKGALAAALAAVALQANVARAQDGHEHDNSACKADREKLCNDAKGRAVFQCLKQHESELSDSCKVALQQHHGHGHHGGGADAGT
jgi:hypothetical protein